MRRVVPVLTLMFVVGALLAADPLARASDGGGGGQLQAGFARTDLTWNVPGAQGQYSDTGNTVISDKADPHVHNVHTEPSDGLHSRSYARAVVIEGPDGSRVAYVGHDLYLQQAVLTKRVAQLVEAADVGLDGSTIMIGASHNHSATYLSSTAWGVWVFTDALDLRFFDFAARQIAQAVIDAAGALRPVQVGAAVGTLDAVQQNILGPAVADDGSPAGFPRDHFDSDLAVVRFDDISSGQPEPLGVLVNLGMHPETLGTANMPSADFIGQVEAMLAEDLGIAVAWSQGAVGDVEPDRDARAHAPAEQREYWQWGYSQMERMARIVADEVADTFHSVATGDTDHPDRHVPFSTSAPVSMIDATFAGPASHPLPTVSNCRSDEAAAGQPGLPVVGLPDCARVPGPDAGIVWDELTGHGVPVPANYGPTGYQAAQESTAAHLQVLRIGEVVLASCPCEAITDMVWNFKSRANATTVGTGPGGSDLYSGFDWPCRPAGSAMECNFATAGYRADDWRPVSMAAYERMRAQVNNDAAGWDDETPEAIATAESEPADPTEIKGNFTHRQIQDLGAPGYTLPLMVGQANDYIGYVVTYREHERGDHYRKALTPFGPHTADYINTRLVQMAAALQGAAGPAAELLDATATLDSAVNDARARLLGESAAAAVAAYEAGLPDDGDTPHVHGGDTAIRRFDGAQLQWVGGSVYTDNPRVRVERRGVDGDWTTFATQDGGRVVVTVAYESTFDPHAYIDHFTGNHDTHWTATFEAFDDTPVGSYRFVVDGDRRSGGAVVPYALDHEFSVERWSGFGVEGVASSATEVSFAVSGDYPDTYEAAGVPYLSSTTRTTSTGTWCFACTFRPWTDEATVLSVTVRVVTGDGVKSVAASLSGGRWSVSDVGILSATIEPGGIVDQFGNTNETTIPLF